MPPTVALILCVILVVLLLHIERKGNPSASLALWIPTFFMLIMGSRPVARWFDIVYVLPDPADPGGLEAGSPLDAVVLIILLLFALMVIFRRKIDWPWILRDNFALIFLYIFLGISILWSDYTYVSFKRWFRLIETILIAMVVLSERAPRDALESVFRRCTYILVPLSLILARYYPHLGRAYGRWSGYLSWIGVTLTKNTLAHLCLFSSIFIIWSFLKDRRIKNASKSVYKSIADGLVLIIALYLLFGGPVGHSATSTANFFVIILSMILLYSMGNRARQMASFLICAVVIGLVLLTFSESFVSTVTPLLGRDQTFTGRTEIWSFSLEVAARHPILGTGYGGYWGLKEQMANAEGFGNTGHNGLLDVYVEVGVVGVILLLIFLLSFFRKVRGELDHSFDWAVFGICFVLMSLLANFSESSFLKSGSFIWSIMIFLTIVLSTLRPDIKENGLPTKDVSPPI